MTELQIGGRWMLTTARAAGSYGQPVLVDKRTGMFYGPDDIIHLGPFPLRARVVVALALKNRHDATPDLTGFLRRFGVEL